MRRPVRFYLEDQKRPATRWKTTLPFPVQVVSRVEVIDDFSKGKLTTEYRYHHGYWDGAEREFRGFGMVEQLDTESFEEYDSSGLHGAEAFLRQSRSAILFPAHPEQDLVSPGAGRRRIRRLAGAGLVGPDTGRATRSSSSITETVNQFLRTGR